MMGIGLLNNSRWYARSISLYRWVWIRHSMGILLYFSVTVNYMDAPVWIEVSGISVTFHFRFYAFFNAIDSFGTMDIRHFASSIPVHNPCETSDRNLDSWRHKWYPPHCRLPDIYNKRRKVVILVIHWPMRK